MIIRSIRSVFAKSIGAIVKGSSLQASWKHEQSSLGFKLMQRFCNKPQGEGIEDELASYQQYLVKFNESLKKPHDKLRKEEERIVQKYLSQKRYSSLVFFLQNNKTKSLCDAKTASSIDVQIAKNWDIIPQKQQISAVNALSHLRQDKSFQIFKKKIEEKIKLEGIQSVQPQKLIVYIYGELINRKSLRFLSKLMPKESKSNDRLEIYNKIYKYIDKKQYRGPFTREKKELLHYIGLLLDPTLNKRQDNALDKQRSPLQVNIQSFLSVLNVEFQRQVKINNYYIDYLVKIRRENKIQQFILEVNGSYHYTLTRKLRGREILRNLIINEYAPLRIIHHQDFIISKGHRNKLAYIQSIFSEKTINWEPQHRGLNSHWQVLADESLMRPVRE